MTGTGRGKNEAVAQVRLWMQLGYDAYAGRQIPRTLYYLRRALDYAERRGLQEVTALICRDLGYIYGQEGAGEQALALLDRGLAIPDSEVSVRAGLLANKARVLIRLAYYREALALLEECAQFIGSNYEDFSRAPAQVVYSYAGVVRMAGDLRKVVDLLDMGVSSERLQVEFKGHEPPWLAT